MLLYDSCGRLVQDHQGLRYYYDRFGHLILTLTPNHDYKFYHYDPAGRLFTCGDERGETVYLYSQNRLTHVKRYTRDTPFPPQTVLDAIKKDDVPNVAGAINGLTAHINLDERKKGLTHATLFHYGNTHALITRCERQPGWPSVLLLAAGCDEPVVGEHRRRQSPLDAFQSQSLSCGVATISGLSKRTLG